MAGQRKELKTAKKINIENPIIQPDDSGPVKIARMSKGVLEINSIVAPGGKIPVFLSGLGWVLYRVQTVKDHDKEFHETDESLIDEKDFTIEAKKDKIVKTIKNVEKISLADYKEQLKGTVRHLAFTERKKVLPDYKINNAALGVYVDSEERKIEYSETVAGFIEASNKAQKSIDSSKTHKEVKKVFKSIEWPGKK